MLVLRDRDRAVEKPYLSQVIELREQGASRVCVRLPQNKGRVRRRWEYRPDTASDLKRPFRYHLSVDRNLNRDTSSARLIDRFLREDFSSFLFLCSALSNNCRVENLKSVSYS